MIRSLTYSCGLLCISSKCYIFEKIVRLSIFRIILHQVSRFCQSREANRSRFNEVIKHRIPSNALQRHILLYIVSLKRPRILTTLTIDHH